MNNPPSRPRAFLRTGASQSSDEKKHTCQVVFAADSVAALSAVLRSVAARELAARIGRDLFPSGVERALAAWIVTGDTGSVERWLKGSVHEREAMRSLIAAVERYNPFGNDHEWPVALVRNQARRSNAPLLAAQLRWAADRIEAGAPEHRIEREIHRAFRIAEGTADWADPKARLGVAA